MAEANGRCRIACEIRFSGSGGQGILLAAAILAEAADRPRQARRADAELRSGGARRRLQGRGHRRRRRDRLPGGARAATSSLCLSQEAYDKYAGDTRPGGLLLYDSGLVEPGAELPDRRRCGLPFTQAATEQLGKTVVANIVALGALVALTGCCRPTRSSAAVVQPRAGDASASSTREAFRLGGELAAGGRVQNMMVDRRHGALRARRRQEDESVDLLEHQGKTAVRGGRAAVLPSCLALTPTEARDAAASIGLPVVVKAQVKTGGRGKAGGIRVCATAGRGRGRGRGHPRP